MKKIILVMLAILGLQNLHASDDSYDYDGEEGRPFRIPPAIISKYNYSLTKFKFKGYIEVGLAPYSVENDKEYTDLSDLSKIKYICIDYLQQLNSPQLGIWYYDRFPDHHVVAFDEDGRPQVISALYINNGKVCDDHVEPDGDVYVRRKVDAEPFKLYSLRVLNTLPIIL